MNRVMNVSMYVCTFAKKKNKKNKNENASEIYSLFSKQQVFARIS